MTVTTNGHTNGHPVATFRRFAEIPAVIDIPVRGEDGDEAVNLDLTELMDEIDELCDLLQNENAARTYWVTIALAYAKQAKMVIAIDVLQKGLLALHRPDDRLTVMTALCWLFLGQCRRAPRVKPTQPCEDERTKDYWLHQATSTLNDASRISPQYPPLFLARGTLYLLRASLQPSKAGPATVGAEHSERGETLKQAAKCFDDAYKASGGRNLLAMIGKARAHFSLGRFAEALAVYQQVLEKAPDMLDPDPRIGIGCCLWQLGHKEPARAAWQRSLDLNDGSNIAHALLGLYYLDESSKYPTTDPAFAPIYKKAMTTHTQTAFKLNAMHSLTCATFGSYFVLRKAWPNVERLARRAIEQTDVNAVASDGWYLLARKEHYEGDMVKAAEYYNKADQARGGDEKGYLPAKFGAAQLKTQMQDLDGAKFRLEKILSSVGSGPKPLEVLTLLGILYAEDFFASQAAEAKEDKSSEQKKAIALLEQVRVAWKDAKRKTSPDAAVLLNLARLYEKEQPERALACLQQVEQMELAEIVEDDDRLPDEVGDEAEEKRVRRELLSPQLLNNIGCFHFNAASFSLAREDFQTALNSCVKMGERDRNLDTDALVTTISYNLARTYEAEGLNEDATKVYHGLLERHPDYVDANARLAYISLSTNHNEGAEAIKALLDADPSNLEIRALYGWYIHSHKKRTLQLNEDQEQRHYKHTLQHYDKHDLYSLVGMGNLHLQVAREMRRETDQDKERRAKTYMRAVEFFDKVLTLDPRNAFAAQGLGIAVVEDKRDMAAGIQIFSKARESLKGSGSGLSSSTSVHVNLGHVFAETRQWSRSIENYELALAKSAKETGSGSPDPGILACLGRVWLLRGRQEKQLEAYQTSLDISRQALALLPAGDEAAAGRVNFRFNVAFVQIQLAQLLIGLPEAQRTLADVEAAAQGLDEAIETFTDIAKGPNPPFPRGDLDARANMGRNTMKRQVAAAVERQAEYERVNARRLEEAKRRREEEMRGREEERRRAAEAAEEHRRKVREERERMAEEDRALIQSRLEEERAREEAEWTEDPDTGERRKKEKKSSGHRQRRGGKRKKRGVDDGESGTDGDAGRKSPATSGTPIATTGDEDEAGTGQRQRKKRKLERRGQAQKASGKYKSAETVEDSSDGEDTDMRAAASGAWTSKEETPAGVDEEEEEMAKPSGARRKRILDEDEEEEEVEEGDLDVAGVDEGVASDGDENHG